MRGPALRAFAVCTACCNVHDSSAPCPTCAGEEDLVDAARAAAQPYSSPRRRGRGPAYLLGLAIGLAAFGLIVLLGS
jgi:hypothetical protein